MIEGIQQVATTGIAEFLPNLRSNEEDRISALYEINRHRIYSFAFWMTDNEPEAERLQVRTFERAFAWSPEPTPELIDEAFVYELRKSEAIGAMTLRCAPSSETVSIRKNTLRVHLERAIVQLPATEKLIFCMHDGEGYSHARIAELLGISEEASQVGLHEARLRIRELVAAMCN